MARDRVLRPEDKSSKKKKKTRSGKGDPYSVLFSESQDDISDVTEHGRAAEKFVSGRLGPIVQKGSEQAASALAATPVLAPVLSVPGVGQIVGPALGADALRRGAEGWAGFAGAGYEQGIEGAMQELASDETDFISMAIAPMIIGKYASLKASEFKSKIVQLLRNNSLKRKVFDRALDYRQRTGKWPDSDLAPYLTEKGAKAYLDFKARAESKYFGRGGKGIGSGRPAEKPPSTTAPKALEESSDLFTRRANASHQALQQALTSQSGNPAAIDRAAALSDRAMTVDPRAMMGPTHLPHRTSFGWGEHSPQADGLVEYDADIEPGASWAMTPEPGINAAQAYPYQDERLAELFYMEGIEPTHVDPPASYGDVFGAAPIEASPGEYSMAGADIAPWSNETLAADLELERHNRIHGLGGETAIVPGPRYGGELVDYNQPLVEGKPEYNPIYPESTRELGSYSESSQVHAFLKHKNTVNAYLSGKQVIDPDLVDNPSLARKAVIGRIKYDKYLGEASKRFPAIAGAVQDNLDTGDSLGGYGNHGTSPYHDFVVYDDRIEYGESVLDKSFLPELIQAYREGYVTLKREGFNRRFRFNWDKADEYPVTSDEIAFEKKAIRAAQKFAEGKEQARLSEAKRQAELEKIASMPSSVEAGAGEVYEHMPLGKLQENEAIYEDIFGDPIPKSLITAADTSPASLASEAIAKLISDNKPPGMDDLKYLDGQRERLKDVGVLRTAASVYNTIMKNGTEAQAKIAHRIATNYPLATNKAEELAAPFRTKYAGLSNSDKNRLWAIVYGHGDRQLAAKAGASEALIDALATWRTQLEIPIMDKGIPAEIKKDGYGPKLQPEIKMSIADLRPGDGVMLENPHEKKQTGNLLIERDMASTLTRYARRVYAHHKDFGYMDMEEPLKAEIAAETGKRTNYARLLGEYYSSFFENKPESSPVTQKLQLAIERRIGKGPEYVAEIEKLIKQYEDHMVYANQTGKITHDHMKVRSQLAKKVGEADTIPYVHALTGDNMFGSFVHGAMANFSALALGFKIPRTVFMQSFDLARLIPETGLHSYLDAIKSTGLTRPTVGAVKLFRKQMLETFGYDFDPSTDVTPELFGKLESYDGLGDPMDYIAPRFFEHRRSANEAIAGIPEPKSKMGAASGIAAISALRGRELRDKLAYLVFSVTDEYMTRAVSNVAHNSFMRAWDALASGDESVMNDLMRNMTDNERSIMMDALVRGEAKEARDKYGLWLVNRIVVNRSKGHKFAFQHAAKNSGSLAIESIAAFFGKFLTHPAEMIDQASSFSGEELGKAMGSGLMYALLLPAILMLPDFLNARSDDEKEKASLEYWARVNQGVKFSVGGSVVDAAGRVLSPGVSLSAEAVPGLHEAYLATKMYRLATDEEERGKYRQRAFGVLTPGQQKKVDAGKNLNKEDLNAVKRTAMNVLNIVGTDDKSLGDYYDSRSGRSKRSKRRTKKNRR